MNRKALEPFWKKKLNFICNLEFKHQLAKHESKGRQYTRRLVFLSQVKKSFKFLTTIAETIYLFPNLHIKKKKQTRSVHLPLKRSLNFLEYFLLVKCVPHFLEQLSKMCQSPQGAPMLSVKPQGLK